MESENIIERLKEYSKDYKKNDNRILIHPYLVVNNGYDYNYFINEFDGLFESYMCISKKNDDAADLFLEEFTSLEEAQKHHENLIESTKNKSIQEILEMLEKS